MHFHRRADGKYEDTDPCGNSESSLSRLRESRADPHRFRASECAAADLSPAYTKAVREDLPNSVLVYDRFHIMQVLHRMITDCRRTIYRKSTDETARRAIKGSRFILLKRRSGLDPHLQKLIDTRSGQRAAVSCPGAEARSRISGISLTERQQKVTFLTGSAMRNP